MKKLLLLLILFLTVTTFNATACCHAVQYRIFPVGEADGKVVLIEMKLIRGCEEREGNPVVMDWKGLIRLSLWDGQQITPTDYTDTIYFRESQCDHKEVHLKGNYRNEVLPYYERALSEARSMPNFEDARPNSMQYLEDDTTTAAFITDTSFIYEPSKALVEVSGQENAYTHKYMFVRAEYVYSVRDKELVVLCFGEREHSIPMELQKQNKAHFKDIESALTYETVTWHDSSADFIFWK
jgi:hypothetical protein